MKKIVVMISGGGSNLQALIDGVHQGTINGEIVGVIADREQAFGLTRARQNGIPTFVYSRAREGHKRQQLTLDKLQELSPDLIVLAGYLDILSKEIVKTFSNKIINIHPSLIPKYCGKGYYGQKVHQAVIENGDKESGVTVHYVDEGVDTGQIIDQIKIPVCQGDNATILGKRVLEKEHVMLVDTVAMLCDKDRENQLTKEN